jgi:hypothetical protein
MLKFFMIPPVKCLARFCFQDQADWPVYAARKKEDLEMHYRIRKKMLLEVWLSGS